MDISSTSKNISATLLLLMGLGFFGLSAWIYLQPDKKVDQIDAEVTMIANCKNIPSRLKNRGVETKAIGNNVSFTKYGLEDWDRDLADFSLVMANCTGFELVSFCMGQSCKGDKNSNLYGTYMKMKLNK